MTNIATYPRCNENDEILDCLLWDCFYARSIWRNIMPKEYRAHFFNLNINDWIVSNLSKRDNWSCVFGVVTSSIWNFRNLLVFEGKFTSQVAAVIPIQAYTKEILRSFTKGPLLRTPKPVRIPSFDGTPFLKDL
ncbi:hypothetical protein AHAS_Ahas20G0251500 [Arachis hypogaea]